jgi:hypothetical protein
MVMDFEEHKCTILKGLEKIQIDFVKTILQNPDELQYPSPSPT